MCVRVSSPQISSCLTLNPSLSWSTMFVTVILYGKSAKWIKSSVLRVCFRKLEKSKKLLWYTSSLKLPRARFLCLPVHYCEPFVFRLTKKIFPNVSMIHLFFHTNSTVFDLFGQTRRERELKVDDGENLLPGAGWRGFWRSALMLLNCSYPARAFLAESLRSGFSVHDPWWPSMFIGWSESSKYLDVFWKSNS